MNEKQMKLERPERLNELKPAETLRRIGLKEGDVVCDIGAGSGVFTLPAARLTKKMVCALEISDDMLAILREKITAEGLENIRLIKVTGAVFEIGENTADIALLVTVLHGISDKEAFLKEVKRIMKDNGKLAVIEFHKRETPLGPGIERRLGREEVALEMKKAGLIEKENFDMGENFYCMVFDKR